MNKQSCNSISLVISQLKNFDIFVNKFFNILCLFMVFTLNLSVILTRIFPQTELEAPSDWIRKVHWTIPLLNIDNFWRRFHIIEKHYKRAKLLI